VMSDGFVEWVFMIPSRMRATLGGDAREEQRIAATVYAGQIAFSGPLSGWTSTHSLSQCRPPVLR